MRRESSAGRSWFGPPAPDGLGDALRSLDLRVPVGPAAAVDGMATSSPRDGGGQRGPTAFVLGGGGSLGAVQVGMLRALLELDIRPDFVVGTSIGSLNGAYLAGHLDRDGVESLSDLWSSVRRADVFRINVRSLLGAVMGHRDHLFEALGLRAIIERADLGFARLEEAPIPVHAVATDLVSATPVVISEGDTVDALLASSAIPGIFPPVNIGGRVLVDGGVLANLPVFQAIELGATRVFVLPAMASESVIAPNGALDLMQRSMLVATSALTTSDLVRVADSAEVHMLPVPATAQGSIFDFGETRALIDDAYLSSSAWLAASQYELAS
jgi:NTE family protein